MIRFPPATVLSADARARLAQGSPIQRDAAAAIAKDDPELLLARICERWQVDRVSSGVRRYVECTLSVDRFDGPFDLRGVSAAIIEPLDPKQTLGVVPPGLDGPLPWLRIGASRYYGDFYVALADEQVTCVSPEVPNELWHESSDYVRASYQRFHQELFFASGWANDLGRLFEFARECTQRGIDDESFDARLEQLAEIGAAMFGSAANIERFLSNRWFNFSKAQLRSIKRSARPELDRHKRERS